MIIEQIRVGEMEVFCYLVGCEETREAAAIDPAGDTEVILARLQKRDLNLKYIINTHGHADHTCGNEPLSRLTGAQTVLSAVDDAFFSTAEAHQWAAEYGLPPAPRADIKVKDGDRLQVGNLEVAFIHTPGHTPGAMCVLVGDNLFTGDTLFVGAVGRTDLPGGSLETLLDSIRTKIMALPAETIIWPGHDYGERPWSTLGEEIETNPYITDFILDDDA